MSCSQRHAPLRSATAATVAQGSKTHHSSSRAETCLRVHDQAAGPPQGGEILELIGSHLGCGSTIITSQPPVTERQFLISGPTIANGRAWPARPHRAARRSSAQPAHVVREIGRAWRIGHDHHGESPWRCRWELQSAIAGIRSPIASTPTLTATRQRRHYTYEHYPTHRQRAATALRNSPTALVTSWRALGLSRAVETSASRRSSAG